MERESVKQVRDIFCEHQSLVLDKEPWDESQETCSACQDPLSGQCYSCAECHWIHLHKRCAEAPSELYQDGRIYCFTAASELYFPNRTFERCFFCSVRIYGFLYSCDGSEEDFSLCMKCALFMLNNNEDKKNLEVDCHPHPLLVVANPKYESERIKCAACEEALSDSICVCYDCGLFLHKKCAIDNQLPPLKINHPCHRRHSLSLDIYKKTFPSCAICEEESFGLSYGCSSCKFYIHPKCAALGSFNNIADETHQHTFILVWRQGSFICDACGEEGHHTSYLCSTCHINVHQKCISLPPLIRITRHYDHRVSHNYFVRENGLDRCRMCYDEVKKEYGRYSCSKEDCNYIVHVNCAIVEGNYEIVNKDEPEDPVEESFQIIERNDNGEAVKIKHFCHEDYLILGDEIKEGDDKCCDGCMLFLSKGMSYYYCSQCDFFLHKTCAELPRKKHLWFHQHGTTLESASTSVEGTNQVQASLLECDFCHRVGTGLFYSCDECNYTVCLRCASLPDVPEHPAHGDIMLFDTEFDGECIGCGYEVKEEEAFKCKECEGYGLCFNCMTLPLEARHKYDKHLLSLVYRDKNDDPEKHYCDVCEEKRDPELWFYLCSICDNSIHPECVLGEYPFIKIGNTLMKEEVHQRPLTFVKKVYDYPKCNICDEPCSELALECAHSECEYIVHYDCT